MAAVLRFSVTCTLVWYSAIHTHGHLVHRKAAKETGLLCRFLWFLLRYTLFSLYGAYVLPFI